MMKCFLTLLSMCMVAMIANPVFADEAADMELPPYVGSQALESLKTLAGTWKGTHLMHGEKIPATVEYKVSSNGSTVVETMFPGSKHEMINVYHDKSGKLAMTHYCAVGNQPHMDLVKTEGKVLTFTLSSEDSSHLADEQHMHDLKITLSDANHVMQEWGYFDKGKEGGVTTFDLVRAQ